MATQLRHRAFGHLSLLCIFPDRLPAADYYLSETRDQPRALIAVERARAKVTTWRMPNDDEPYIGIWARRYYATGSKMVATAPGASAATGAKIKVS